MDKIVNRIILLRHEERVSNPEFDSPLTENGLEKSNTIFDRLDKNNIKITSLYSSPYIRCLQTLNPIVNTLNKKINVDYSLAEWFNKQDRRGRNTIPRQLTNIEMDSYLVNKGYLSFLSQDMILQDETSLELKNRVSKFINFLVKKYSETDDIILLVSHLSVINEICNKFGSQRGLEDHFNMGSLIRITDLSEF